MNIVLIGAGNVATHMGKALYVSGNVISQVYSRTYDAAQVLATELMAMPISSISEIKTNADLYILSVKDDALAEIINQLPPLNGMIVHTSGSMDVALLSKFNYFGVIYPLQTLSKHKSVDITTVPLFIEANDIAVYNRLFDLCKQVSSKVMEANSKQRVNLHVAAVFATNFTHHLFVVAKDILDRQGIDFKVMQPLLVETLNKAMQTEHPLKLLQTGPAVRNDKGVMNKHLEQLAFNDTYQKIYDLLSKSIAKTASN